MWRIYVHELRRNVKSLIIWSVVVLLLMVIALAKFEGYHNNPELMKVLEQMPKAMLDAFNMRAFNLTTLEGFYGVMAVYYYLMAAIASAMWAANAVASEEYNKTAEFTLVLPLSRRAILTGKALAALTTSMAFVLITWVISCVGAQRYDPIPNFYHFLTLEMAGMFFISLISWALGLAFAAAWTRPKRAASAAVVVLLVAYVLSTVQGMHERLRFLKWVTPFKYFDAAGLYHNAALNTTYIILTLVLTAALVALSYVTYERRDLVL